MALPDDVLQQLSVDPDKAIKIVRKHRGMTQEDLAQATGLSRPYLTEIETGRKDGSIKTLKSLARALNVPLELLV